MLKSLLFTLEQAFLSTLISVIGGWLVARALWQYPFWQRIIGPLLRLFQNMPSVLIILCLILTFGSNGFLSTVIGRAPWPLYGLSGVVTAHVLLNLPLIAHRLLETYQRFPPVWTSLGVCLSLSLKQRLFLVEGQALADGLRKSGQLCFCLCFTSLTLVLALGGGPDTTTLPVLIYQVTLFSPNLGRALGLIALQTAICYSVLRSFSLSTESLIPSQSVASLPTFPQKDRGLSWVVLGCCVLIFLVPLLGFIYALPQADFNIITNPLYHQALFTSLALSVIAAFAALTSGWFMLALTPLRRRRRGFWRAVTHLPLVVPSYTLTALTLFLWPGMTGSVAGIATLKAFLCLPFAVHFLEPLSQQMARHAPLLSTLRLSVLQQLWWILWPLSQGSLSRIFGILLCYSLGEVNAVFMLGGSDIQTLPLLIYNALSRYRLQEAITLSVTLLGVMGIVLLLTQRRWQRHHP